MYTVLFYSIFAVIAFSILFTLMYEEFRGVRYFIVDAISGIIR